MSLGVITVLGILLVFPIGVIFAENDNGTNSVEESNLEKKSKTHPLLLQWQQVGNPNEFAQQNQLLHKDNKIGGYIHVPGSEQISQIPSEIEVIGSDKEIVVAFVTAIQLDSLEEMDFVTKITLPDVARPPPLPETDPPKTETPVVIETGENGFEETPEDLGIIWIIAVVIGVTIIVIVIRLKRAKR